MFKYLKLNAITMVKKGKKMTKKQLIMEISKAMKDPEFRKGIRQFIRATTS